MKILVTGGSGTIGGYVLRELLQAGHAVTSFSRTAPRIDGAGFIAGDIMDPDQLAHACQEQDAVIHLAAVPGPGRATPAQLAQHQCDRHRPCPRSGRAGRYRQGRLRLLRRGHRLLLPEARACPALSPAGRRASLRAAGRVRAEQAAGRTDLQALQRRIRHPDHLPAHQQQLVSRTRQRRVAVRSGWAQQFSVEELWSNAIARR